MAHSVSLSWVKSTDAVDGYNVYRGTTAAGESTTPINAALITGTTYVDTVDAAPGDNFYVVKSSLGGVLSIASDEVEAVLLPAPATDLAVTASS